MLESVSDDIVITDSWQLIKGFEAQPQERGLGNPPTNDVFVE
jgi:hypothetical protein